MISTVVADTQKRNATASWSGYVYQGKVGMLVGIRNISKIFTADSSNIETALAGWQLEFETFEDFDIKSPDGVVSRHQVKAKKVVNAHTKSAYTSALSDFDPTGCPEDTRYLHVICAVTNWDTSDIANPHKVKLYEYPDGSLFCDLANDQIQQIALTFLRVLRPEATDNHLIQIYHYLNFLVLETVNKNHTSNASFNLLDLYKIIAHAPVDELNDEVNEIRLKDLLVKCLCELESELHSNEEELGVSWEAAESHIEDLCQLEWGVLKRFLMNIHPANSSFDIDHDFNSVGFKDVFLDLIRNVRTDFNADIIGYRHNKEAYIASTINNNARAKVELARQVVSNPNNTKVMFEGKNIVTRDIRYDFSELNGKEYDNSILKPNNIKFTPIDDTVGILNEARE